MNPRSIVYMKAHSLALLLILAAATSACNGIGSTDDSTSTSSDTFSTSSANVAAVTVGAGPASAEYQTFNIPFVTVTVCAAGGSACATIPDVLVDTGSSGLRLMASVLQSNGLTLTPTQDPDNSADTLAECLPFADGYAWGALSSATVSVGGEITAGAIPIQVIDDNGSGPAVAPDCASENDDNSLDSVDQFDANGVLGIATFNQDCGSACVGSENQQDGVYWSCPSTGGGGCALASDMTLSAQVANPVASFPADNNGTILQLGSIAATGATAGSGYLVFGIGTETNNKVGSATLLVASDGGVITTTFGGSTLSDSFFDSGSNALFFDDSTLEDSPCGTSGAAAQFYCPTSTVTLSATNEGSNGASSSATFQVANLNQISESDFAINDVAGTAIDIPGYGSYFDWGLPFFYGRTIFTGIEGLNSDYPYGYYAY